MKANGTNCSIDSSDSCPFHVEPIAFAEAQRRFRREAVQRVCDTGRYRCPYYVWGSGPALVFVPGLVDDALCFVLLVAHLSRWFRCIVYDWPNGETDAARLGNYHHQDFTTDLFAVLDDAAVKQVFPLGYSFGSTVVLRALHAQPDRFSRAVLLSGFARRRLAPAEQLLASFARYWKGPLHKLPLRNWVLHNGQHPEFSRREAAVWKHYLDRSGAMPMAAVARRALVLDQVDLRPLLPSIRQEILLLCGDCDPLVNKQCETDLLMGLPHVARLELSNCGHMMIFTHPETVAEVVAEFLNRGAGELCLPQ